MPSHPSNVRIARDKILTTTDSDVVSEGVKTHRRTPSRVSRRVRGSWVLECPLTKAVTNRLLEQAHEDPHERAIRPPKKYVGGTVGENDNGDSVDWVTDCHVPNGTRYASVVDIDLPGLERFAPPSPGRPASNCNAKERKKKYGYRGHFMVKCPTFRQQNLTSGGDFGSAEPKFGQPTCASG